MDIRFDGKRALVTGAGKGIGNAIAKALAAGGAVTFALDIIQENLDKLKSENPDIHTVCVDLSDWATTRNTVKEIGPIDLLVNSAAIFRQVSFLDAEETDLNETFDINIKAAINVSQVVAKGMVERGKGGAIVHISSIASKIGVRNRMPYCVSKGGLDQVMRVMALELGPHQIRVNCVNPTVVKNDMGKSTWDDPVKAPAALARIPQGKFAEVKDIVHPVLYLLSDKADMINGVALMVDGAEIEQTTTRGDTMRERRNKLSGMTRLCVVLVVMVSAATERQVKLGVIRDGNDLQQLEDWEGTRSALRRYNAMYTNTSVSVVTINVTTATPFDVFRTGLRKGNVLSPLLFNKLHMVQNSAASIRWRVQYKLLVLVFTALHGLAPGYIRDLVTPYLPTRNLRYADLHLLVVPRYNPEGYGERAFSVSRTTLWNPLPENVRQIGNLTKFKTVLKTHLFKLAYFH
ncbi:L-xylulose reductase [Lamellibrachia satsuma]|nr:L-xylulose reductase [Lamellibrachia satsuma]